MNGFYVDPRTTEDGKEFVVLCALSGYVAEPCARCWKWEVRNLEDGAGIRMPCAYHCTTAYWKVLIWMKASDG